MVVVGLIGEVFKVHAQDRNSAAFYGAEHVEIPVPQGRGGRGCLLGARPNTNSAASSAHSGAAD